MQISMNNTNSIGSKSNAPQMMGGISEDKSQGTSSIMITNPKVPGAAPLRKKMTGS